MKNVKGSGRQYSSTLGGSPLPPPPPRTLSRTYRLWTWNRIYFLMIILMLYSSCYCSVQYCYCCCLSLHFVMRMVLYCTYLTGHSKLAAVKKNFYRTIIKMKSNEKKQNGIFYSCFSGQDESQCFGKVLLQ